MSGKAISERIKGKSVHMRNVHKNFREQLEKTLPPLPKESEA